MGTKEFKKHLRERGISPIDIQYLMLYLVGFDKRGVPLWSDPMGFVMAQGGIGFEESRYGEVTVTWVDHYGNFSYGGVGGAMVKLQEGLYVEI